MSIVYLFLIQISVVYVSCGNGPIGNYPDLNPRDCGLSRHSSRTDDDCFQWHKIYGTDSIRNGRNATVGEAPWTVYIRVGTTITNGLVRN